MTAAERLLRYVAVATDSEEDSASTPSSARQWDLARTLEEEMRGLGLRVAMDDFGTGYSSLSVLKHAPVDIVKIDRSFVQGLCGSAFDHSFVHLMVELCHSVGIRVCVEGVETTAELAALQPFGADYLQGFLLGHPEPAARFAPLFL